MKAIILAAGQGKRMHARLHKLLHPILGKPLVRYVADAALNAGITDITAVLAKDGEEIKNALPACLSFVTQHEPRGTGHAVKAALSFIRPGDDILILHGDMPLTTPEFIHELKKFYMEQHCSGVITAEYKPADSDFGRVYHDDGLFEKIIEHKDLKPGMPVSKWVNASVYLFKGEALLYGLEHMTDDNSQKEYYLTDVPGILRDAGYKIRVYQSPENPAEFSGINTQAQLAEAVLYMRKRINNKHMERGVRILDPASVFIDDAVEIEGDVVLYPGVILEGNCKIGRGSVIGPDARLINTVSGADVRIQYSVSMDAHIGDNADIGPYAYLRPGTRIGRDCRIGNFVEIKNASVGERSKAAHFAYIGDAEVGSDVNYSCGAITANYDGKTKHRTIIHNNAFIGSNATLVAPVHIGEGAFVAAGSTITDEVPEKSLAIARQRQVNKLNWKKKT